MGCPQCPETSVDEKCRIETAAKAVLATPAMLLMLAVNPAMSLNARALHSDQRSAVK
jgi:hypothetical protein